MTFFERLGGDRLRTVLEDFYDRVFADVMIGFLFVGKDRQRLVDREWEMAARMLGGADVRYTGKPMREAHARVPILGGHFDRRTQLLRNTLADHHIEQDIVDAWIEHTQALRAQVTADPNSDCNHDATAGRTQILPDDAGPVRLGRR